MHARTHKNLMPKKGLPTAMSRDFCLVKALSRNHSLGQFLLHHPKIVYHKFHPYTQHPGIKEMLHINCLKTPWILKYLLFHHCFCNHIHQFPMIFFNKNPQKFPRHRSTPYPPYPPYPPSLQGTWKLFIVLRMPGLNKALLRLKHISIQVFRRGIVNLITSYPSPI